MVYFLWWAKVKPDETKYCKHLSSYKVWLIKSLPILISRQDAFFCLGIGNEHKEVLNENWIYCKIFWFRWAYFRSLCWFIFLTYSWVYYFLDASVFNFSRRDKSFYICFCWGYKFVGGGFSQIPRNRTTTKSKDSTVIFLVYLPIVHYCLLS